MLNQIEREYKPVPYAGQMVVFRGRGLNGHDAAMGWDGLAARIDVREIGDGGLRSRRDIMNEPLVSLLAQELKACMERSGSFAK